MGAKKIPIQHERDLWHGTIFLRVSFVFWINLDAPRSPIGTIEPSRAEGAGALSLAYNGSQVGLRLPSRQKQKAPDGRKDANVLYISTPSLKSPSSLFSAVAPAPPSPPLILKSVISVTAIALAYLSVSEWPPCGHWSRNNAGTVTLASRRHFSGSRLRKEALKTARTSFHRKR